MKHLFPPVLTVLFGKLLRFLIRDISLGFQVGFVSYEDDHLEVQRHMDMELAQ